MEKGFGKKIGKTTALAVAMVLYIVGVVLFITTLNGCKGRTDMGESSPNQKITQKKSLQGCKILRSFNHRYVDIHVSRGCFETSSQRGEKGTGSLHMTALFPMDRSRQAARVIFWYLKEAFPMGTNIQAIQRTRAWRGNRGYILIVYRLEHSKRVGFCQFLVRGRTPHAAVVFSRGCWGPKKTQMLHFYMSVYFAKKDWKHAAEEVAVMLAKWNKAKGPGWNLGDVAYGKCRLSHRVNKKGEKVTRNMCVYVYKLVRENDTI